MADQEGQQPWDGLLQILSGLITFKTRADGKGWRDAFENMPVYLQRLGIEEDIRRLKVIHVAGTKGKGSTCAMVDSILRSCGYRTSLFTSPHLCDVRERVRINGEMVSKEVFQEHFWWCHNRLLEAADDDVGMPGYFRFLTLLGLKIFLAQELDAVILEVGIGGRLDATNIIPHPIVTGIASLGFDHMELLGDTLGKIAGEKAGIFKEGCPAVTVTQPEEAMEVLQERAAKVGVSSLTVPAPLSSYSVQGGNPLHLGIQGAHQELNASLAVQLAAAWEAGAGLGSCAAAAGRLQLLRQKVLPLEYAQGLAAARWPGRSQVVEDEELLKGPQGESSSSSSRLRFYLDGAHTPESMVTCAEWFAGASVGRAAAAAAAGGHASGHANGVPSHQGEEGSHVVRVLVFNCMKERDPAALLPQLHAALARSGWPVQAALFVPPDSQYAFLASSSTQTQATQANRDLSWQQQLKGVWEDAAAAGGAARKLEGECLPPVPALHEGEGPQEAGRGAVLPSVAATLDYLRAARKENPLLQLEVLVTGSLYLVGDVLRALGKAPP